MTTVRSDAHALLDPLLVALQATRLISDEVEQLRAAGHDDEAIAAMVCESTGGTLTGADITEHYAPPEARGWAGGRAE